ncbi:hypothetical protein RF55_16303 [Lasius niger]|uniref:Uncharacterized protein n=1 Tax=Lasius niger TaxID=67767 RepID=A0A0J7K4Z0_LASNI|nr:hypothetical protein RF55_16303 [Lasius niger]
MGRSGSYPSTELAESFNRTMEGTSGEADINQLRRIVQEQQRVIQQYQQQQQQQQPNPGMTVISEGTLLQVLDNLTEDQTENDKGNESCKIQENIRVNNKPSNNTDDDNLNEKEEYEDSENEDNN